MAYSIAPTRASIGALDAKSLALHQSRVEQADRVSGFSWGHLLAQESESRPCSIQSETNETHRSSLFRRKTPYKSHVWEPAHSPATKSTSTSIDTAHQQILQFIQSKPNNPHVEQSSKEAKEFLSFQAARDKLRQLEITSEVEWNYVITEPGRLPADIPVNPEVVYQKEWISVKHWLGATEEQPDVLWIFSGTSAQDSRSIAASSAARFRKHPHPLVADVRIKRETWHCSYCYRTLPRDTPRVIEELKNCALSGRKLRGLLPRFRCSLGCEFLLCKSCKDRHCTRLEQDELTMHLHKVVALSISDQRTFREAQVSCEFLGKVQQSCRTHQDEPSPQTFRFITNTFDEGYSPAKQITDASPGDRLSLRSLKLDSKTRNSLNELFHNHSISSDESGITSDLTCETEEDENFVGTLKVSVLENTLKTRTLGVAEVRIYRGMIPFKKWIDVFCPDGQGKTGKINAEVIFIPGGELIEEASEPSYLGSNALKTSKGERSVESFNSSEDVPAEQARKQSSDSVGDAEDESLAGKEPSAPDQQPWFRQPSLSDVIQQDRDPETVINEEGEPAPPSVMQEEDEVEQKAIHLKARATREMTSSLSQYSEYEQLAMAKVQKSCQLMKYTKKGIGSAHTRKVKVVLDASGSQLWLKTGSREPQIIENVVEGPNKEVKNRWGVPFNDPHHFTITLKEKGQVVFKSKDADLARSWSLGVELLLLSTTLNLR